MSANDWGGRKWGELSPAERRAHADGQLRSNMDPFWKRVWLAMVEHGCSWSEGIRIAEDESPGAHKRRSR